MRVRIPQTGKTPGRRLCGPGSLSVPGVSVELSTVTGMTDYQCLLPTGRTRAARRHAYRLGVQAYHLRNNGPKLGRINTAWLAFLAQFPPDDPARQYLIDSRRRGLADARAGVACTIP